jgi:hypothetical protein
VAMAYPASREEAWPETPRPPEPRQSQRWAKDAVSPHGHGGLAMEASTGTALVASARRASSGPLQSA